MHLSVWPPGLNNTVDQKSYTESLANNITSSDFDIGPPQIRRRSTGAPVPISMSILCTTAQVATFKGFYKDTLISGSQRFEWEMPIEKTDVVMLFNPSAQPSIKPAGGTMYSISLSLLMYEDIPV